MLKIYSPIEFKNKYNDILLKHEDICQLIVGNVNYCIDLLNDNKQLETNTLFGSLEKDDSLYLFCNFLPYNLVLMPIDAKDEDKESLVLELANYIKNENIYFTGIQSDDLSAEIFLKYFDYEYKKVLSMSIMTCHKVNKYPLRGELISVQEKHYEELSDMIINFYNDALKEKVSKEDAYEKIKGTLLNNSREFYIYEVNKEIIGMIASTRKMQEGRSISYVYIKDEYRTQGYCKEMISKLTADYLDQGLKYLTLYVDRNNPYSNGAYLAVGYEYVLDISTYELIKED